MSSNMSPNPHGSLTPFEPGKYWYATLEVPAGVRALSTKHPGDREGVRLTFTTREQRDALVRALVMLASSLVDPPAWPGEPPEVNVAELWGK